MLAKLQRLWIIEATNYNVLPIDDRGVERANPEIAGRPTLIQGNSQQFFPGMGRLSENSVVSIKNKSFSVTAEVEAPISEGTHQVRMEFAVDGGGLAKGGGVTLYYDGNEVGTGRVEATQAMIFSADETTDIGYESGTTVTHDYTVASSRFTGKIHWAQIDLGTDDHDHFIDPEERLRVAMARQ